MYILNCNNKHYLVIKKYELVVKYEIDDKYYELLKKVLKEYDK